MNREEFLKKLKEIIQTEEELTLNTNLIDIDEWDSLSMISTVAFIDSEFKKQISVIDIQSISKIEELVNMVGL